ncbi:nitronate monooxygenase family protein [Desemzia sp. C1]|uniref:nitronate monooxygenase n=1 Tax=Desemzia sp. C1 TaxID=2892016 RepID=UPI001E5DB249|nr:nitronate monooxygenase [Desemzia sp. C1]MCI3029311.1 nitronate monooxygenase family protein [Desemzia sp. C1]
MSITNLLNIKYPIIQGAMAHISTHILAAAVSEAGGLGVLSSNNLEAEKLREEIRSAQQKTTNPIGVNLMLRAKNCDQLVKVVIEEGVKVITTSAGSPAVYLPWLKENNVTVIPVVSSVEQAIKMELAGVDAVIAEGTEAGGHIGEITTMALIPQVINKVDLPVIAAGGIGDGKGLVASLALGAQGIQMGTRFLASDECPIPEEVKDALVAAQDNSTIVTGRKRGVPIRSIKNGMLLKYAELEFSDAPAKELENLTVGSLKRALINGDMRNGSMMAGQIVGLINDVKPVKKIIKDIMAEAEITRNKLVF